MINEILNGDSASSIRAKLNEMITIVNDYSSSQYAGPSDPGPGGGEEPGGGGADSVQLYSSGMAGLTPEADPASACATINVDYENPAYIQKDASNMGGTTVPEVNDFLYEDSSTTMPLSDGYYGWDDMENGEAKSIYVVSGQISSITICA